MQTTLLISKILRGVSVSSDAHVFAYDAALKKQQDLWLEWIKLKTGKHYTVSEIHWRIETRLQGKHMIHLRGFTSGDE